MAGRGKKKNRDESVNIPIEGADMVTDKDVPQNADDLDSEKRAADAAENNGAVKTEEAAKGKEDAKGKESAEGDLVAEAEAIIEDAGAEAAEAGAAAKAEAAEVNAADQLDAAKAEAADWQDRYMRLHAEWDTYRRRTSEQRAEEKARATEKLVEDLLPVLDDFERTVSYAQENGETGLLDGVKAVQSKLIDMLSKAGLETINPEGLPFDALEAQAVGTVPDEEAFEETVHDVYQKGYRMGKKVLRPAMVTVTTGGPVRPKEEDAETDND